MNNVKTKNSPNMRFVPLISKGFPASCDIKKSKSNEGFFGN